MPYLIRLVLAKPRLILGEMCRLYGKLASYLRRVLLFLVYINGPIVLPDQFQTVAAVLPSDWAEKHVPYFPARLDFLSAPLSAPGSPRMIWVQSSTKTNSLWESTTYDQWKAESIENKLFMPRNHKLQANWNLDSSDSETVELTILSFWWA